MNLEEQGETGIPHDKWPYAIMYQNDEVMMHHREMGQVTKREYTSIHK